MRKKSFLFSLLLDNVKSGLALQKKDGSMPAGHNGPYFHKQTPIRNTGHWLITFIKVYQLTGEKKYLKAAKKCIEYLVKQKEKSTYNLHHRTVKNRDKCNGLIGPAWSMEAFLFAGKELNRPELIKLAADIFNLHVFDKKMGLWRKKEINGDDLGFDWTFNHQLWFAAVSSDFDQKHYKEIHRQIRIFLNKLTDNLVVAKDGLIKHHVRQRLWQKSVPRQKEIGYQQFNLYAFGLLKKNYPNLEFWQSETWNKALNFIDSQAFKKGLENNIYSFGYNLAGIETAFALQTFKPNSREKQKFWLEQQFNRKFVIDDEKTYWARMYEAYRLKNLKINLITEKDFPFVSVIVPAYNDQIRIKLCLKKLLKQTYLKNKYEIIVIDNQSTDETRAVIKQFPVKLLEETKKQSSYAARNVGIKTAKGKVLAFTDSDCQPEKSWLENGVRSLLTRKCQLVAGQVKFLFHNPDNLYEIYDSVSNMQQEEKIKKNQGAATANLFSYKKLFKQVGYFDNQLISGGDISWTLKAIKGGNKICYEPTAVVEHPTRDKIALLKKQIRIGYGQVAIIKNQRKKNTGLWLLITMLKKISPPTTFLRKKLKQALSQVSLLTYLKIYLIKWRCAIYTNIGILKYLKKEKIIKKCFKKNFWLIIAVLFWLIIGIYGVFYNISYLDEAKYLIKGWLLASGEVGYYSTPGFYYQHMPGGLLWFGWGQKLLGRSLLLGRFQSWLIGCLILFFTYKLGRVIGGKKVGKLSLMMMALMPVVTLYYSSVVPMSLAALMLVLGSINIAKKKYQWGSFWLALAMIVRKNFLFTLPLYLSYLLVTKKNWRLVIKNLLIILIILAVVILPGLPGIFTTLWQLPGLKILKNAGQETTVQEFFTDRFGWEIILRSVVEFGVIYLALGLTTLWVLMIILKKGLKKMSAGWWWLVIMFGFNIMIHTYGAIHSSPRAIISYVGYFAPILAVIAADLIKIEQKKFVKIYPALLILGLIGIKFSSIHGHLNQPTHLSLINQSVKPLKQMIKNKDKILWLAEPMPLYLAERVSYYPLINHTYTFSLSKNTKKTEISGKWNQEMMSLWLNETDLAVIDDYKLNNLMQKSKSATELIQNKLNNQFNNLNAVNEIWPGGLKFYIPKY